jgi:hypothetical protein
LNRLIGVSLTALVALSLAACVELRPGRCDHDTDCQSGLRCNLDPSPQGNGRCVPIAPGDGGDARPDADGGSEKPSDGSSEKPDAPSSCTATSCSGTTPICDGTSKVCRTCSGSTECAAINSAAPICAASGACVECGMSSQCGVAAKPICDATSNACRACAGGGECAARDAKLPACATSGKCVECVMGSDCKMMGKPICDAGMNTCRACQVDSECPADPGVCMTDGHCATSGEVIFLESTGPTCPGADGSSSKPYCMPGDAASALTTARHIIVVRGALGSQVTLSTTGVFPTIVGRKNSVGVDASIPATNGTAITVTSDTVLIRDLTVNLGSTPTSKGAVATGSSTKLTLVRVTAALLTGVGIDAESGATLTMDQCYVQNNSAGGILVSGAKYDIQNSVLSGNLYGVKFNASAIGSGSRFWFNTVVKSLGNAVTCDSSNPQTIAASIVDGANDSCTLSNSVTTAPTFSAAKPFHLTGHLACPAAPATFPDHDIDGDPRVAPIDCGADQYVP